jgi:hypothetical protein
MEPPRTPTSDAEIQKTDSVGSSSIAALPSSVQRERSYESGESDIFLETASTGSGSLESAATGTANLSKPGESLALDALPFPHDLAPDLRSDCYATKAREEHHISRHK